MRSELSSLTDSGEARGRYDASEGADARRTSRGIKLWLNTPDGRPVSIQELRGKVVLVDFWTYSCINCLRTLPHLKAWDRAYRKAGLTIVGVHSPEFAFERVPDNVRSAVRRLGVRYPVALDNDFATWRAYSNDYWPSKYLIDKSGRIRYEHYGEGGYGETENVIRRLLGEKVKVRRTSVADETPNDITTRETYLGYARIENFASRGPIAFDTDADYTVPGRASRPRPDRVRRKWKVESSRIVAGRNARLRLNFQANDIFLVLAGSGQVEGARRRSARANGSRLRGAAPVHDRPVSEAHSRSPRAPLRPGLEGYAFTFG